MCVVVCTSVCTAIVYFNAFHTDSYCVLTVYVIHVFFTVYCSVLTVLYSGRMHVHMLKIAVLFKNDSFTHITDWKMCTYLL